MNKLTHNYICFSINGYKEDLLKWLNKTISFFEQNGLFLKRVLYDRVINNNSKFFSQSLLKFHEHIKGMDITVLHPFIINYIENAKIASTEHYGCFYDQEEETLLIYFDESYNKNDSITKFIIKYISMILLNNHAISGYFYTQQNEYTYFMGGANCSQNLFKENGLKWWNTYNNKSFIIGKFRHIYKINLLSIEHLSIKIGNDSFREWVKKNNYGKFKKIASQNWLWIINETKQQEIAQTLFDLNLLIGAGI